ncbi:MAG: ribonuclease HIII [Chlamydia sp. 32-24]|nr:MAG: ribonuclease HIII [Chlamydia sp. 32-24]
MSENPKPLVFVTNLDKSLETRLKKDLQDLGFVLTTPPHTYFSAKKTGCSCTFYLSGKFTVQGKDMANFIEFYLEPQILQKLVFTYSDLDLDRTARIGIDESGKGDFFGPLCVAGVFAFDEQITELKKIGVKDSKGLNDQAIAKIAQKIKKNCLHHIVKINPYKYNELYLQFKNLNYLLGWGHATVIEQMIGKSHCHKVIIDQFANEYVVINALKRKNLEVELTQRHKGEEDIVVAAASILARDTFVNGLLELEEKYGVKLPKGASALTKTAALNFIKKFGKEELHHVCKVHFKTYLEVTT